MMVVFNATGSQRKALADALGEIIGAEKKYQGVPSCAYRVGEYTIDREGNIEADCIKEDIIDAIKERGFLLGFFWRFDLFYIILQRTSILNNDERVVKTQKTKKHTNNEPQRNENMGHSGIPAHNRHSQRLGTTHSVQF